MLLEQFERLLENGQTSWLDWKRDFPAGLLAGRRDRRWQAGRGELLKDLAALANGADGKAEAFLVYGVKDLRTHRQIFGTSSSFDDAVFQEWAQNTFRPTPRFAYTELDHNGARIGVFTVRRVPSYPHVVTQDLGDILYRGQIWHRVGTRNDVAGYEQMRDMFRGEEPFRIDDLNGPFVQRLREEFNALGRELAFPTLADRDAKLAEGYELAFYPGTRREIWAGAYRGQHMHIGMLKPRRG